MISELEQIAKELEQYRPEADEYAGRYIHKGWAERIRHALEDQTALLVPTEKIDELVLWLNSCLNCAVWDWDPGQKADAQSVHDEVRALLNAGASARNGVAIMDLITERIRQDEKWGGAEHDDQHTSDDFVRLVQDYASWARVMAGMGSPHKYRRRMVQVAALAIAAVETTDRRYERQTR